MSGIAGRLFVAILLMLCVGIHVLEMSGRWDRTFQDANDEAGLVSVVLCIGVAVSIAGTLLERLLTRAICRTIVAVRSPTVQIEHCRITLPTTIASPPLLPLRI